MSLSNNTKDGGRKMKISRPEISAPLPRRRPISVTDKISEKKPSTNPATDKTTAEMMMDVEDFWNASRIESCGFIVFLKSIYLLVKRTA